MRLQIDCVQVVMGQSYVSSQRFLLLIQYQLISLPKPPRSWVSIPSHQASIDVGNNEHRPKAQISKGDKRDPACVQVENDVRQRPLDSVGQWLALETRRVKA